MRSFLSAACLIGSGVLATATPGALAADATVGAAASGAAASAALATAAAPSVEASAAQALAPSAEASAAPSAAEPVAEPASAPAVVPASAAPAAASAPTPNASVEQPRSFGHVLGDVLTQRVRLSLAAQEVQPTALPAADRVGLFLERRAPRVEEDGLGQRWLVIDYQVINAPRALTALALPALSIATSGGALQVAAWPISVGPITPAAAFNQGDLQPLRPDRTVEPLPTAGIERQLKAALIALAAVLAAWAAWCAWRNAREAQRLPFARAWQQLRRLDPASADAWLALHHALNATAGRAVHGSNLPRLLADAPHLQPLRPQLEAFFRHSGQRFFAATVGAAPADFALRDLSLALREAERRHHA